MIIAIDGPAGSGKSSTARRIARRLDGFYLDTGAMYRAVGVALKDSEYGPDAVEKMVNDLILDVELDAAGTRILVNGADVTEIIRSSEASKLASSVSKLQAVRSKLVSEQRRLGRKLSEAGRFVVVEGRDIGTVVFPDAEVKFFMDADPRVRAQRRHREMEEAGADSDLAQVLSEIEARDKEDREREHSPLRKADDAIAVDTTRLTPEEQVDIMVGVIAETIQRSEND
ncbi:MAG: (d)CMP kinase [Rhodothermia bacterium]|nr:(d)CMP kinase [Rhodothermia bacterium]